MYPEGFATVQCALEAVLQCSLETVSDSTVCVGFVVFR